MKSKPSRNRAAKMLTCCLLLLIVFVKNSSASSNNDGKSNELGSIHQEIELLRDENKNQNMKIGLLKEKIESQDKTIHLKIIEELNNLMMGGADHHHSPSPGNKVQPGKRPARLLPAKILYGNRNKNKTENTDTSPMKHLAEFYGPPTSCSELSLLGYTLNGYYLVNSDANKEVSDHPETVYCAFKQPGKTLNPTIVEKRISRLKIIDGSNSPKEIFSSSTERSIAPKTTSAPPRSAERSDVTPRPTSALSPLPRRANLINLLGKCAAISEDSNVNGRPLIQNSCTSYQKGMQWGWNETSLGSGFRHLCNGHGKCVASRNNNPANHWSLVQWDYLDKEGQKFHFIESQNHRGYYLIKNDFGQCMSVPKNTKDNLQEIYVSNNCNDTIEGQLWKWKNF